MSGGVVLLSGGIDSAAVMCKAAEEEDELSAVFITYGQRTEATEWNKSHRIAKHLTRRVESFSWPQDFVTIDYKEIFRNFSAGVTDETEDLELEGGGELLTGYVPMRNLHFLSTAGAIAYDRGYSNIYVGFQDGDPDSEEWTTPDQSKAFVEASENAINESSDKDGFEIRTPFSDSEKHEVIEYLDSQGIRLDYTYSCYESPPACGECASCNERIEAFKKLEMQDPIAYDG